MTIRQLLSELGQTADHGEGGLDMDSEVTVVLDDNSVTGIVNDYIEEKSANPDASEADVLSDILSKVVLGVGYSIIGDKNTLELETDRVLEVEDIEPEGSYHTSCAEW
jgi:hypothetical protein